MVKLLFRLEKRHTSIKTSLAKCPGFPSHLTSHTAGVGVGVALPKKAPRNLKAYYEVSIEFFQWARHSPTWRSIKNQFLFLKPLIIFALLICLKGSN